jgi:hypothetical protein
VAAVTEGGLEGGGKVSVESLRLEVGDLRDELLGLSGVAEVEVASAGGAPDSVRVQLAPDADPALVGAEVQRVLASFGMRSRVSPQEGMAEPVLPLTVAPQIPSSGGGTPPSGYASPVTLSRTERLASIRVEEGVSGLAVTAVGVGGREETRTGEASERGMEAAVVAAVSALAFDGSSVMVSTAWSEAGGGQVATVVMERPDGTREAGAAVVAGSRAYALARATWRALTY